MQKKFVIVVAVVCIIAIFINLLLYCVSYHEKNNYLQILSIQLTSDSKYLKCDAEKEIEHMEHKLRKINFYPANIKNLQESPQYCINIIYDSGFKKQINVSGFSAMIVVLSKNGDIVKGLTKFYYVNPFAIYCLFR